MSGAHTPGPWSVDHTGDIVSGPYNVCIPYATKPEDKQLIAAAPGLLAALEDCLAYMSGDISGPYQSAGIITEARAAIAKARGEV